MKYTPEIYARSFDAALEGASNDRERDAMISRFVRMLARHGDLARSKRIVDAVLRALLRRRNGRIVRIEAARPLAEKMTRKLAAAYGPEDHVETIINPAIVAGVRITVNEERELDLSFATRVKKVLNI